MLPRNSCHVQHKVGYVHWKTTTTHEKRLVVHAIGLSEFFPWEKELILEKNICVVWLTLGLVLPGPSFGENLVNFHPLLDFDTLVEEGAPRRS
jgi:hypothetical protein